MIKNKNNSFPLFLDPNFSSCPEGNASIYNTKTSYVVANFNIIEYITIDLPIAYANIRV